jgi:hypothetical protein
MSSRGLLNLAMAGIAIGLGLVTWFRPGLEPTTTQQPLTTLSPVEVNHIQVSRLQRPELAFTRQAETWLLAGDPPLPASPFQVQGLLALLQARTERHYPADSLDLQGLGLDPPQASVILDDNTTFLIGNTEPLDNMRYVQYGTTVYLVEDHYQHLINADRTNFIERRLLDEDASITRLALPDLTLTQDADGHWEAHPDKPAVSAAAVRQLLVYWQQASALYVRPYAPKPASSRITLELANSETPIVFELLADKPELILARPDLGIQYHFSQAIGERLLEFMETVPGAPADTIPGS